jgi:hypothetical protein
MPAASIRIMANSCKQCAETFDDTMPGFICESGNQKRFWRDPVKQCHSRPNSSASEISRDDLYDDGRGTGVGRGLGVGVTLGVFKRNVQVKSTTGPQPKAPAGI